MWYVAGAMTSQGQLDQATLQIWKLKKATFGAMGTAGFKKPWFSESKVILTAWSWQLLYRPDGSTRA